MISNNCESGIHVIHKDIFAKTLTKQAKSWGPTPEPQKGSLIKIYLTKTVEKATKINDFPQPWDLCSIGVLDKDLIEMK